MGPKIRRKKSVSLGTGFGDYVGIERSYHFSRGDNGFFTSLVRTLLLVCIVGAGIFMLAGRLFYLTVVQGAYYSGLSEKNRVRQERIPPARGVIYSREGEVLAGNRPIYKYCQTKVENDQKILACDILPREMGLEREAKKEPVTVEYGREYPHGPIFSHAVGYLSEITKDEIENKNKDKATESDFCQTCYGMGDMLGVSGIEEWFEGVLRGTPGKRLVEVGADERELVELARIEPTSGLNIYTSLDYALQDAAGRAIERVLSDPKIPARGAAIIASNPKTGEIFALLSSPTFDANSFVGQDKSDVPPIDDFINDPGQPLFNRAVNGLYPPGSTFKIVTTAAGLEEGVLDEKTLVEDTGVISIGKFSFANWYFTQYGGREENVDVVKAMARSNDIFYYKVGEWLGIEKLSDWGRRFKIEEVLPIELAGAQKGLVRRDREWFLGDTYHAAIGQGDVLSTPLHVNVWSQIIANDGLYCPPTLLAKNPPSDGKSYKPTNHECVDIGLKKETIRLIREGMKRACSTGGTAYPLFDFAVNTASASSSTREFAIDNTNFARTGEQGTTIAIACKTGTSEFGHPEHKTHAWLTAFAPAHDPEIAVTVLVEEGGEGSSVAAPIVKTMLEEWFSKERTQ